MIQMAGCSLKTTNRITDVEEDCKKCIINQTNVFIKRLWFPLAPADYICIHSNTQMTKHNIIVEAVCDLELCQGIESREPRIIIDPMKKLCINDTKNLTTVNMNNVHDHGEIEGDFQSIWPQTLKLCVHIGEGLFVLFVLVSFLVKSRQQLTHVISSVYRRIVNFFQLRSET